MIKSSIEEDWCFEASFSPVLPSSNSNSPFPYNSLAVPPNRWYGISYLHSNLENIVVKAKI